MNRVLVFSALTKRYMDIIAVRFAAFQSKGDMIRVYLRPHNNPLRDDEIAPCQEYARQQNILLEYWSQGPETFGAILDRKKHTDLFGSDEALFQMDPPQQ